ncbi:MAG: MBL fold metallo-hydrolase [Clostridiales bacterium]|nr:MBL fold metallo-hydrolase [Clostridiales bacterium]
MSLRICSLASGSKGNCCYISDGNTHILIDLGISATRVEKCLKVLGVDADNVNVLVTHCHSDHIGGLKIFCKNHCGVPVLCQKECTFAVKNAVGIIPQTAERTYSVGTLCVSALPVSHDVPCFGYIVSNGEKKVAVVTDVGALDPPGLSALSGCDIVMLEANHDIDRLQANPRYTAMLKARIRSRHGHLSNADCAAACAYLASNGVKNFILAHLSEENNTPEIAIGEVQSAIKDAGIFDARVVAAGQNSMTGLFEVC